MDQIFVVDTMQTQRVLDGICGQLPLKDILTFERVNRQTRAAVRAHQYDGKLLFLGLPRNNLTGRLTGTDGSRLRGPILTRLCISLELHSNGTALYTYFDGDRPSRSRERKILVSPYGWDWLLSTLRLRAAHLKELELRLETFWDLMHEPCVINRETAHDLNRRAEAALAGIVFGQCTKLRIRFNNKLDDPTTRLLPDLLRYFPAAEHFEVSGSSLPQLSTLPAPHKLKTIDVDFKEPSDPMLPSTAASGSVANFSGLKSFSVSFFGSQYYLIYADDEDELVKIKSGNLLADLNGLTGVNWVASFESHPPVGMQIIRLPILARWSLPLLVACSSASPTACRKLTINYILQMELEFAAAVRQGPVGEYLQRVTHLTGGFSGERAVGDLLGFTPALKVLKLDLELLEYGDRERCDLAHPLPSLTKLLILEAGFGGSDVSPTWVESVRRNAAQGLEVVIKEESFKPDHDYLFEISENVVLRPARDRAPSRWKLFWKRLFSCSCFRSTS